MGDFSKKVLDSLMEFQVCDDIHRRSDLVSSFAFLVCDMDVKDTLEAMMMGVIKAVHDSCPNASARYDAIRALKVKTESLFLQYEDAMQNDPRDPFISFVADISTFISTLFEDPDGLKEDT